MKIHRPAQIKVEQVRTEGKNSEKNQYHQSLNLTRISGTCSVPQTWSAEESEETSQFIFSVELYTDTFFKELPFRPNDSNSRWVRFVSVRELLLRLLVPTHCQSIRDDRGDDSVRFSPPKQASMICPTAPKQRKFATWLNMAIPSRRSTNGQCWLLNCCHGEITGSLLHSSLTRYGPTHSRTQHKNSNGEFRKQSRTWLKIKDRMNEIERKRANTAPINSWLRVRICLICSGLLLAGCICLVRKDNDRVHFDLFETQTRSARPIELPPWIKCSEDSGCAVVQVE